MSVVQTCSIYIQLSVSFAVRICLSVFSDNIKKRIIKKSQFFFSCSEQSKETILWHCTGARYLNNGYLSSRESYRRINDNYFMIESSVCMVMHILLMRCLFTLAIKMQSRLMALWLVCHSVNVYTVMSFMVLDEIHIK